MNRRTFLGVVGAAVTTAGCSQADTQPDSVPVWLDNQADQQLAVEVGVRERSGGESLISTTVTVDSGTEESVYARPIRDGVEYSLSVIVDDHETEQTISGGGLRDISVTLYSSTNLDIRRVDA